MKRLFIRSVLLLIAIFISDSFIYLNALHTKAASNIIIDGYYDDWSDKPYSWEYSHDNPYIIRNYWNGTENITYEYRDEFGNPYNLDIRHKMALYCDGEYVYLHILISSNPGAGLHGEDFRFYIDGEMAAFRLTYIGGDRITKKDKKTDPGIYSIEVRHRETGLSNSVVEGAQGAFTKKPNDENNEVEIKIPLAAMKQQNNHINLETFNVLEFYTPNLMYRRIACSGVSSGPFIGIAVSIGAAAGLAFVLNKFRIRSRKL